MSYTKERLERVLFSIPYADASQALLIRAADKDKIKTIADMSGRILGIKLGSPGETLKLKLDQQLKTERGAGFKDVKTYDDHPAAYLALAQGSVDGVLNTVPTLAVVMRDSVASRSFAEVRPFLTRSSITLCACALPLSAEAWSRSISTTSMPARAET